MGNADWEDVAWSDEAYVCLDDKKGRVWVTRRPGEELLDECCVPTVPQSPIRVMVWGIIMKNAKGPLLTLEYPGGRGGGMTARRYIDQVLEGALVSFHAKMKRSRPNFRFQQDGTASHRAKLTKKWLDEHDVPISPIHRLPRTFLPLSPFGTSSRLASVTTSPVRPRRRSCAT
ncbi:hypothetical protein GGX14DRAFT_574020 [Mycena pura]|uniref:Transposase n=1 Tax=Mycena pura TaxID=153505 RepID=A0AAD6V1R9_9AGAR|nr:hypothetical protein GGX14DRAFT_574020 [Mycena pura]